MVCSSSSAPGMRQVPVDGVAYAEPRGHQQPRLRPAEDPGNGAQIGELGRMPAPRRPRADLGVLQLAHRRGLLEVGDDAGVVEDVLAIKAVGEIRQLVERGLPLRLQHAGEVALAVARVGPRQRIERSGNHQLQIALGQHLVGIFEVEHLALLGNAQLAVEGIDGLREDGAMRGSAAAAHRAAAPVEDAQLHAALARHHVQIAMRAEDLPRRGQHAAVFIRVGVAEHDLLPVVPGWRAAGGSRAALHSSRQMAGALRRSSIDSKSGTGIRPGSRPGLRLRPPP